MFNKTIKTMKSIKSLALMGAVALLGTVGFSSCEQKNNPENKSGEYNGETVKTQFSISIPEAGKPNAAAAPGVLRMPATNTQDAGNFLGMDNIVLIPFNTAVSGETGSKASAPVASADTRLAANITLPAIPATGDGTLRGTPNYKIYDNVSIPLGTNHFLFYAHGTTTATPTEAQKFQEGLLNVSNITASTPASIQFSPVQIYTTGDDTEGAAICAYLTDIANAKYTDGGGDHTWAAHANAGIKQLHDDFITMKAGSATTVLAALEDLYNSLDRYNTDLGTPDAVVNAVIDKIDDQVDITGSTVGSKTLAWKSANAYTYPANINLPDGAAAIAWTTDHFAVASTYEWQAANPSGSVDNNLDVAKITDYVYPACIYYYANSGLKTATNTPLTTNAASIDALANWDAVLSGYYTTGYTDNIYVSTNTRSVAIKDVVQYGVARLKTAVKAGGANILDSKSKEIDVTKLQVNAVLVGGQGPVRFDFTTESTGDKIVYDKELTTPGTYTLNSDGATYTTVNPTLLLETKLNQDILMAVEFINNDKDFYGIDNKLIPVGTKFYVVAKLLASAATSSELTTAGKTGHVFAQDFTTTVKLNLANLTKAYNVIPDLKTAALELGFSVDLSWQTGATYSIDIQ